MNQAYMLDESMHGQYNGYHARKIEYILLIYAWFILYLAKLLYVKTKSIKSLLELRPNYF